MSAFVQAHPVVTCIVGAWLVCIVVVVICYATAPVMKDEGDPSRWP